MVQHTHFRRLVQNEIEIHSRLEHQHVVQFIESFNDDRFIYMLQSLCVNNSLCELLKIRREVKIDECRYFLSQILKGVDYIHKAGIIHRDLKPCNILIDANMQLKIADFGLAIEADNEHLKSEPICGTTNYLAPEVVEGRGVARRSDIWACGVIAYKLLFRREPFKAVEKQQTYDLISQCSYL